MVSLMWSISRKSSFNDAMPFLFLIREVIESEYYFFTEMRMQTSCLARCTMPWTVCNTQNRQVGGKMFRQSGPTAKSCETQLEDLLEQHLKDYPTFEEQRVKQTFQEQHLRLQAQYQTLLTNLQTLQERRLIFQEHHQILQVFQEQHLRLQAQHRTLQTKVQAFQEQRLIFQKQRQVIRNDSNEGQLSHSDRISF